MATVEIRPGDTLSIVWSSVQDTPLGTKKVESNFNFSYDELLSRLKNKAKIGKNRQTSTAGAQFSRVVALSTNALKKGKWSTGAEIDRSVVFNKLLKRFHELEKNEYKNLTEAAHKSLKELLESKNLIKASEKKQLQTLIQSLKKHISSP